MRVGDPLRTFDTPGSRWFRRFEVRRVVQGPVVTKRDFAQGPLVVFYEVTQACDLVCRHCRASAQPRRHPEELSTEQACALLDQLARFPVAPFVVLTGGDPLKRPDLFQIISHGVNLGLPVAITPSATPLLTRDVVHQFARLGVRRLAVSLDGADAATHDAFRGWPGSFQRTLEVMQWARQAELPLQVNTTVVKHNLGQLDRLAELLAEQGIVLWSVFFLVPTGRGLLLEGLSAEEYELAFEKLYRASQRFPYAVKTTEAPHYRRWVLQQRKAQGREAKSRSAANPWQLQPTNDGRGTLFIGHTGRIYPSGFLPVECGRFPQDDVVQVYQRHPTFLTLRNPDLLQGKCGLCEYRTICGGSRARSYALTGELMAEEPCCAYVPPKARRLADSPNPGADSCN